jgi:HK97 family phage major capsid protein/HK97 family phage prohead protease
VDEDDIIDEGTGLVEVGMRSLPARNTRVEMIGVLQERADGQADDTYVFSFSSQKAVERYFGDEVLSHADGACELDGLNAAAPLLWNHNRDAMIGVITRAWIEKKRGYVEIRFGTSPMALQMRADVDAQIVRNVSVGYRILEITERTTKAGRTVITAVRWRPYEVSLVSIPADPTVGIGRAGGDEEPSREVRVLGTPSTRMEATTVDPEEIAAAEAVRAAAAATATATATATQAERTRIATINAMAARHGHLDLARELIDNGRSLDDARAAFLERMGVRQEPVVEGAANLDLSDREQRSYSLVRAINAQISGDWSQAGFERECSQTIGQRANAMGTASRGGFYMPMNLRMTDDRFDAVRTTYNTGTAGQGGNLVATDLLAGSFIDMLRNRMVILSLGARMLSGLVGNVAIPRQATGAATYWVAEGVDITQSEGTFDQVTLSPKTLGVLTMMTRQMLQQGTPDIEALARADMATAIALGIDLAAISGSGSSGQPRGIVNTSGIGAVVGGTNGLAISIDHLIDLETAVSTQNADVGSLGYATNAKVVGALKKLKSTTGEYLWSNAVNGNRGPTPGDINGYGVARTNQITSTGTKGSSSGVCSTVLFGNWADLMIGEWGVLEVLANPFGTGYAAGSVAVRGMQTVDVAVRNPKSFAAMTDALT